MAQSDASVQRSEEQAAKERAMGEVSDVLTVLDQAVTRAEQAHQQVASSESDRNAELALGSAVEQLQQARQRLVRDTYYTGDSLRLL